MKIKQQRLTEQQAKFFAETLDEMEAELVGMQHKLFRMRRAMQAHIGETVGFQYDDEPLAGTVNLSEASTCDHRGVAPK